jgi:predicted transcriptional regulator of viral defense system
MDAISRDKAIKILHQKRISFFDVADAKKIFGVKKENTLYKLLQRLEKSNVIGRITKGRYLFLFREYNDFELANFLIDPSYVSLESALSFYGILPQFPYTITSVTPLKSKKIIYQEKEYEFNHLEKKYFFGFIKKERFLIASPEKALLDELYFMAKKLRKIQITDLDLNLINKKKFKNLLKKYKFLPLQKLIKRLRIC